MQAFGFSGKNSLLRVINNWKYLSNTKCFFHAVSLENCNMLVKNVRSPLFPDTRLLIVKNCSNEFIKNTIKECYFPMVRVLYLESYTDVKLGDARIYKDSLYATNANDKVYTKESLDNLLKKYNFETVVREF
jgi:hypothetical protein